MPATKRRIDPIKAFFEFSVEGRGEFPWDMLRYDQCWPKSESRDSAALSGPAPRVRTLTLVGLREPTVGRWESFGWKVL